MYTQRGRLTQDDAARELKKQRSIGSEQTWQPSKKDYFPALGGETSGDNESEDTTPTAVNAKPASRVTRAAPPKAKQSKTAKSKTAKKTTGKARAAKTAKPAAKRAAAKTVRKAVLVRKS